MQTTTYNDVISVPSLQMVGKITYMPYGRVVWVALPVACKRKKSSSDTVNVAEVMTSFISTPRTRT